MNPWLSMLLGAWLPIPFFIWFQGIERTFNPLMIIWLGSATLLAVWFNRNNNSVKE